MAGLSMGGMQTKAITVAHPEVFSNLGIFSGGTITVDDIQNNKEFADGLKLVFVSFGSRELENRVAGFGQGTDPREETEALAASGLPERVLDSAVRVSLSFMTTEREVDALLKALAAAKEKILHK